MIRSDWLTAGVFPGDLHLVKESMPNKVRRLGPEWPCAACQP